MNSDLKPELLANEHCGCGENPLWDERHGWFLWCDIPGHKIFAWDAESRSHRTIWQGNEECGAFTLQEDGSILLLFTGRAERLDPVSGETTPLLSNIVSDTGRFNDCIADPNGRVFSGTVDWETQTRGALFRLDHDGSAQTIYQGTACSNGLGFSPDLTKLYWADSTAKTVYLFDYDQTTSTLSNQRPWLETPGHTPDGLTVDANGDVWVAFFSPGALRRYASDGTLKQEIEVPAKHVTSCIFGGANMDQLLITTAGGGKKDSGELDGATFVLQTDTKGQERFRSKIAL